MSGRAGVLVTLAVLVGLLGAAIGNATREPGSVVAQAELVGEGVISTALDELNAAITPDGREFYYTINSPNGRIGVILVSPNRAGSWGPPEVAPFSGRYTDYDPMLSPDGSQLFFISNRPKGTEPHRSDDFDIYRVRRSTSGAWGEPENLGAPVNTTRPEYYPSIASDGTLYFSANRDGGKGSFDVYRSRLVDGKYTEPENLGDAVNSPQGDIDNYVAPDQSLIVWASYGRPDELGRGDLYVSFNRNGTWTPARHLPAPINSPAREYCPIGSPDGKYFYFTSMRGFADRSPDRPYTMAELRDSLASVRNGQGNIYRVPMSVVLGEE